jgi:hypothetical protein
MCYTPPETIKCHILISAASCGHPLVNFNDKYKLHHMCGRKVILLHVTIHQRAHCSDVSYNHHFWAISSIYFYHDLMQVWGAFHHDSS